MLAYSWFSGFVCFRADPNLNISDLALFWLSALYSQAILVRIDGPITVIEKLLFVYTKWSYVINCFVNSCTDILR